jgi:hypothetical protein
MCRTHESVTPIPTSHEFAADTVSVVFQRVAARLANAGACTGAGPLSPPPPPQETIAKTAANAIRDAKIVRTFITVFLLFLRIVFFREHYPTGFRGPYLQPMHFPRRPFVRYRMIIAIILMAYIVHKKLEVSDLRQPGILLVPRDIK